MKNKDNYRHGVIALALCLSLLVPFHTSANNDAGLAAAGISPTRIVAPANEKSASVTLTNTSTVEIAYRMTLIEMGLDEGGFFGELRNEQIPEAQRSAKPIVRFSPRQVRLKPGASQVVRALVRRAAIPEFGEYRSHLRLQALPVLSISELEDATAGNPVLVQSSAKIEVGVTIPVIVRHGETQARVTLNQVNLNFDETGKANIADILLGLEGDRSTYGDITVSLVNGRDEKHLGRLRAFALYYPYPQEWVNVELEHAIDRNDLTPSSKIRVRFENKAVDSSQADWLDDSIVPLVN